MSGQPVGPKRIVIGAVLAILAMVFAYGVSTTRQSARLTHGTAPPTADQAVLRVVNAYGLPVRIVVTPDNGTPIEFWPVGPGSDHLTLPGSAAPVELTVTTYAFRDRNDLAPRGTHRFTARADAAERMTVSIDGEMELTPSDEATPGRHAFSVRGDPERTMRAWSWTEAERVNRSIYTSEQGIGFSFDPTFTPGADITITWEVASVRAARSAEVVLRAGDCEELIVDRDGTWTTHTPGAWRAWWMRR